MDLKRLHNSGLLWSDGWIDGEWVAEPGGARFPVINPANGAVLAQVANLGALQTERAIAAAERAGPGWAAESAASRADYLHRWAQGLRTHADDLAWLMTAEQGKPLTEAQQEVASSANVLDWFAQEARRVGGEILPAPVTGRRAWVLRQPVGVCGAITPWNFPLAMIARKVAPALAAGCTLVVKPAEDTPLTALALAEIGRRAGLPAGVWNVVVGDRLAASAIGLALCLDPRVRKMSVTGSTEVGRVVMRQSAQTLKRLSLELGGHAALLVFEDADVDAAVVAAIQAKFRNAGQTCICPQRFLVHESIYESFIARLVAGVRALAVGPGWLPGVAVGPLIHDQAVRKVEGHVADARRLGARVRCGGQLTGQGGLFYQPTVLSEVSSDMLIAREEVFGPVLAVTPFSNERQALILANQSEYGLAAYVYTRDVARVFRVTEGLQAGMVAVNTAVLSHESLPFGGIKQSGFGREGSRYGIDEYLQLKTVSLGGV